MFDPITLAAAAMLAQPPAIVASCAPVVVVQEADQALEAVEKVIQEFTEEQQAFYRKVNAAETDEERAEIFAEGQPDPAAHFAELREIAEKHPGSEAAARAASWILASSRQGGEHSDWAMDVMLSDFVDSEHIADVVPVFRGLNMRNIEALERIRAEASNDRAKALADYYRAGQLLLAGRALKEMAEPGSVTDAYVLYDIRSIDEGLKEQLAAENGPEQLIEAGEKLYEHCKEAYDGIEVYPDSRITVATKAGAELFEFRHLQVGDVAPDIEGVDAEGIAFNLHDYRGQVILLDFWGFW